tara:strand:+ start:2183 stop:2425 length:243 start_codon:yes stop_codon:yes gene_type:complete
MFKTTIEVSGDKRLLDAYHESLKPEQNFMTQRASYKITKGKNLKITIKANDAVAFRAVMTTLTGLMAIVQKTWNVKHETK